MPFDFRHSKPGQRYNKPSLACTHVNLAFLSMLLLVFISSSSVGAAPTYRGKVVDAETGEPLEGAVFVIVWMKKPMVTMDGPRYFHNAREDSLMRTENFRSMARQE